MSSWIPGEVARLSAAIADIDGAPADPGAVRLRVKSPTGQVTVWTYGVDGALVRDRVGGYRFDLALSAAGNWAYRWETDAPQQAAAEGIITVARSAVL